MSEKKSRSTLVEELRDMAGWTPPICYLDIPQEIDVPGQKVTVYCKPFEQFQGLMHEAAEAIAESEPVRHGRWSLADDGDGVVCSCCGKDFCNLVYETDDFHYCPNCGAKMDGDSHDQA